MRLLFFFIILTNVSFAQPPVRTFNANFSNLAGQAIPIVNTVADLATYPAYSRVQLLGYYEANDGGGALLEILPAAAVSTIDTIHTIPLSNGNVARLPGQEFTFKQYGFIDDVIQDLSVDISGDVVTCLSCSFEAGDTSKMFYIQRSFDVGPKFDAHPRRVPGSFANWPAVPASYAGDSIVHVLDPTGYDTRDTLTSDHYFVHNSTFGWVVMLHLVDAVYNITQVISPTQVRIDYTAPNPLIGLAGHYGTDNSYRWRKIKQFIADTGLSGIVDNGDFMVYYGMETTDNGTFYFDDGDNGKTSERNFNLRGYGPESRLHFWYTTDTLGFVTDPTQPDNNFLGGFFNYADPRPTNQYDEIHFNITNLSFKGVNYTGFRNVDGRNRNAFTFGTGKGSIYMSHVSGSGGDGIVYHGGDWVAEYQFIKYNGLKSAEVGFQNFGVLEFTLKNFLLYNIGPFEYYTVFSSNGRGRPTYTHPTQKKVWISDGEYRNNPGVNHQLFSGGGADAIDSTDIDQTYQNLKFVWSDDSGYNAVGLYAGRVGEKLDIDNCTFTVYGLPNGTGGGTAILLIGEATITNCNFNNVRAFAVGANVGTNNQRFSGDSTASVYVSNATFKGSSIDISNLGAPNPEFLIHVDGFDMLVDSTATGGNFIRITNAGSGTLRKTTAIFENGQIEGYLNNEVSVGLPNEQPLVFVESTGPLADLIFRKVDFRVKTFGTGAHQFLVKQLRSDVSITFEDCTAPAGDTVYFDLDPGPPNPILKGHGNEFSIVQVNNGGTYTHELKFKNQVCDTIVSATTIEIPGINCNEFYLSGTTPIQTINLGLSDGAGLLIKDDLFLNFIAGGTLDTGGNIDVGTSRSVDIEDRVRLRYNPATQNFRVIEINSPF